LSYNILLNTPKTNTIVKPVLFVVTIKLTLTSTNCGKTDHSIETCHNKKKKVPVVPTAIVKSIEHVVETITQPIKIGKILVRYPYIIYYSA
jgi:metal-sulfur cluster biosynthetic enzyme